MTPLAIKRATLSSTITFMFLICFFISFVQLETGMNIPQSVYSRMCAVLQRLLCTAKFGHCHNVVSACLSSVYLASVTLVYCITKAMKLGSRDICCKIVRCLSLSHGTFDGENRIVYR